MPSHTAAERRKVRLKKLNLKKGRKSILDALAPKKPKKKKKPAAKKKK